MNNRKLIALLLAAATQGAMADEDSIHSSFDRMLNHEPYAGTTVTTLGDYNQDPVADRINAIARGEASGPDHYSLQVVASFDRMMNHEPYAGATAVSTGLNEQDRMEEAVHAALRGENGDSGNVAAQSFERMLGHTSYAGPTVTGEAAIEQDVLGELVRMALSDSPVSENIALSRDVSVK